MRVGISHEFFEKGLQGLRILVRLVGTRNGSE